jgi:hypothetical protein
VRRKIASATLAVASVSLVGGIAYAATQSVSTRPAPQLVIPAASIGGVDDDVTASTAPGTPTTIEDRDRPRGTTSTSVTPGTVASGTVTRGTTVTTVDDRGRGRSGADDVTTSTTRTTVVTSVPSTVDDRGGHAEPGDDRSGRSGSSNSGPGSSSSGSGSGSSGSGSSGSGSSGSSGGSGKG